MSTSGAHIARTQNRAQRKCHNLWVMYLNYNCYIIMSTMPWVCGQHCYHSQHFFLVFFYLYVFLKSSCQYVSHRHCDVTQLCVGWNGYKSSANHNLTMENNKRSHIPKATLHNINNLGCCEKTRRVDGNFQSGDAAILWCLIMLHCWSLNAIWN